MEIDRYAIIFHKIGEKDYQFIASGKVSGYSKDPRFAMLYSTLENAEKALKKFESNKIRMEHYRYKIILVETRFHIHIS